MQLKDHLIDRQLHIVFDLQRGEQQVITVIRHIIRDPLHTVLPFFHTVGDKTHMLVLRCSRSVIYRRKIHRAPIIGQDGIYDKIRQFPAVIIAKRPFQIVFVHAVEKCSDVVQSADLFFQGLLHDKKQCRKKHIHLFVQALKPLILPDLLLGTILYQFRITSHMTHTIFKLFQKVIPHRIVPYYTLY